MILATKTVFEAALNLSTKDRTALARELLHSLEKDGSIPMTADDADRRFRAFRRDELKGKPLEEAVHAHPKKKSHNDCHP